MDESMTMTPEENCNLLLRERGYIVIAGYGHLNLGEVIEGIVAGAGILNHKVVVIGATDWDDYRAQCNLLDLEIASSNGRAFYRVTAE